MDWSEVAVLVPEQWAEAAIALFDLLSAGSAVDEDDGRTRVRAWFVPERGPSPELLDGWCRRLEATAGVRADWSCRTVRDEDWREGYKRFFQPFPVGERLWVVPSWQEGDPPPGRAAVRIDPGLAFGTGQHATTRQMLELLEQTVKEGDRVLDVGTGSGILALAAVGLGAGEVLAFDNDPGAVAAARENCREVSRIRVQEGDFRSLSVPDCDRYDVVVSNLVADPVIELTRRCGSWLDAGGRWLVGGVISSREDDVRSALLAAGWRIDARIREDEWVAMRLQRCSG